MNLVSSAHQASPPSASYSHLRTNSATGGSNTNSATLNSLSSSHAGVYASTHSSGIRKKPAHPIKHRSYSSNHGERLHQLALEQAELNQQHEIRTAVTPCAVGSNWLTPQHSPEPSAFLQEPVQFQQYNTWSAPTPPRSDSGLPTLAADIADEQPAVTCAGVSSPGSFAFEQVTASPEMSSLGFLLPSQYANGMYPSEPSTQYNMDPNYVAPLRSQPVTTGQPSYTSTVSSSPSLYQSRAAEGRRDGPPPATTQSLYASSTRRLTGPYDSPISNEYSMPASQSIPSISGLAASPMTNVAPSPYSSTVSRPMYDNASYYSNGAYTQAQPPSQMYAPQGPAYSPYVNNDRMAADARSADAMRQNNNQRPKPQCWDHGCNGRQFSTFSNLLRHQREKSGTAAKSYCPKCGAEFTRTTARNGHVAHDKCTKTSRRQSEDRS